MAAGAELLAVTPHPFANPATNKTSAIIGANPITRLRCIFFIEAIIIPRKNKIPQAAVHRSEMNGICRKFRRTGEAPFATVATLSESDPPATTLVAENVHVATGGHPAIENVTCPLNGGLNVLIVNAAVPPAVIDTAGGEATSPAGIGALKLKTVLPPHSAEFVPVGGHSDVSNAVTMKKYVVPDATLIWICDCFTEADTSLLHATFVKLPAVPVYADSTVSYELPSVLATAVPVLPAVYRHHTDFPDGL